MPLLEQGLVLRHIQLHIDIFELEIMAPSISCEGQPGQFIHIKTGINHDPLLRRPLSIYDLDKEKGSITLLYKVVGRGTSLLSRLRLKDSVDLMGPLGKGFSISEKTENNLLVGGGIGVAPLIYLARVLKEKNKNVRLLHGAEDHCQLLAAEKIEKMGVDYLIATADGSAGFKGLVTELMYMKVKPSKIDYIYTCGPEAMMAAVQAFAKKHGIPGEVSLEEYMACGVGACLGCARKLKAEDDNYVKVCKDGPVFNMDELEL